MSFACRLVIGSSLLGTLVTAVPPALITELDANSLDARLHHLERKAAALEKTTKAADHRNSNETLSRLGLFESECGDSTMDGSPYTVHNGYMEGWCTCCDEHPPCGNCPSMYTHDGSNRAPAALSRWPLWLHC